MNLDALYPIAKSDLPAAVEALDDAFRDDVLWGRVFEDAKDPDFQRKAFFECPLRYGLTYGKAFATSSKLEGIAVWVPGKLADMSFWRMLRSGAIGPGSRMGMEAARRLKILAKTVNPDRKRHMKGRRYVYLMIIGVVRAHQRGGFGGRLLRAITSECDAAGLPLYLETETEKNLPFYERHGFTVLERVMLPGLELPMWEMAREPSSDTA